MSISMIPVLLVRTYLDRCTLTFGVNPCTATGAVCSNTYSTCRDRANYTASAYERTYTQMDTPLPKQATLERPYVSRVNLLPTEISDSLTVSGRLKVEMADDYTDGVSYWRRHFALNRNFKGRELRVLEGNVSTVGWFEGGWFEGGWFAGPIEERFWGQLVNVQYESNRVIIEAADPLKGLDEIDVPAKSEVKLAADIDNSQTTITLTSSDELQAAPSYVVIGEELVKYTAIDAKKNQISGCTRGAEGTEADTHNENAKVQPCHYFAADNPFDVLQSMLTDLAGIDSDRVDTTAWAYWKDWPETDMDVEAIIWRPTSLRRLYFELVELMDCRSWVSEEQLITIRRNLPNVPGREYFELSDGASFVLGSTKVDIYEEQRLTRVSVYWQPQGLYEEGEPAQYTRLGVAIDEDAESADEYDGTISKDIWCRWLNDTLGTEEDLEIYVAGLAGRILARRRDAQERLTVLVHPKDADVLTGSYVLVTTSELYSPFTGVALSGQAFMVSRRQIQTDGLIELEMVRQSYNRICFIAPDATPDYDDADAADREYGFIWSTDLLTPEAYRPYTIY